MDFLGCEKLTLLLTVQQYMRKVVILKTVVTFATKIGLPNNPFPVRLQLQILLYRMVRRVSIERLRGARAQPEFPKTTFVDGEVGARVCRRRARTCARSDRSIEVSICIKTRAHGVTVRARGSVRQVRYLDRLVCERADSGTKWKFETHCAEEPR